MADCDTCSGTGMIYIEYLPEPTDDNQWLPCSNCGDTGTVTRNEPEESPVGFYEFLLDILFGWFLH